MHQRIRVGALRLLAGVALAGAMVAPNLVAPGTALAVSSPTITSFSPKGGPVAGGTAITVHGTGFVIGARLRFGGTYDATNVIVANSTTLTATTPAPAVFGPEGLQVINTDSGKSRFSTDEFNFWEQLPAALTPGSTVVASGWQFDAHGNHLEAFTKG
nr:IPT/TIG domain-containing protein [Candidatus Dormibacteraeota bacterium]